MNSKHVYFGMIGVIVLLVGAIFAGTYLANQQIEKKSAKLTDYKTIHAVLSQEKIGLAKAKKDVLTYSELEKIAKTVVPQDKDQAKVVREIVNIAAEVGIRPSSIAFPVSNLDKPGAKAAAGAVSAAPKTTATPQLSQLTPVKDIKGVYVLQITIQQDATTPVPYKKFIDFLSRLEKNRRTAQVTSINLQPATDRNNVAFTLTVEEFIKP